jgi:hypothetical protein
MADELPVSGLRIEELLEHIGSSSVSPGAGAAGAVALALAAACANKAVSVTLKHRPDDQELRSVHSTFLTIVRAALAEGDRDSYAFQAFIRDKEPSAVDRLVCEGEKFGHLIVTLQAAIDIIEPRIQPNMSGDLVAAKALAAAARRIQERNEGEALQLR